MFGRKYRIKKKKKKSVVFGKDGKGISFKNRLKGHINWRKVRNLNVI
jgi:hypothetical protein